MLVTKNEIIKKEKDMRRFVQKASCIALSVMAVMATISANVACRGRCYEPEMPDELRKID
jgi:cyclic lactone autoinducer peptide